MASYCVVFGCSNSYRKIKKWKETVCTEHGILHRDCACLRPFKLYEFPSNSALAREWVAALNRKDFKPRKSSAVFVLQSVRRNVPAEYFKIHSLFFPIKICSDHFIDKKPTERNPTPQL